jgi:hypothetical protein
MAKHRLSLPALAAAAVLALAPFANATVFIGLQQDAGPIFPAASNALGVSVFAGPYGEFETVVVAASGQPAVLSPLLLQGTVLVTNIAGAPDAGTLKVYITSTGNTSPDGIREVYVGFRNS